jgi:hypothetical protein
MIALVPPFNKAFTMNATDDVGRVAAKLLLKDWQGHRVVELTPNAKAPCEQS